MKLVNTFLDACRTVVRGWMNLLAGILNTVSGGKLSPNAVTILALLMHLPIAWRIATNHYWWAAALLLVFGLFDALDGALARLQKRAGNAGMLLDATTDRIKETMLYCGIAYSLAAGTHPKLAVWAVAACGASLCVSYVKAKGETAVSDHNLTPNEINRLFQDGLLRFEIRMTILIVGLVFNLLTPAVITIAVFSTITAIGRLVSITKYLLSNEASK
jgi:CDP-diacylglycerol--glycerol-3-phosphate 3-phosphatidyltransferase